MIYQWSKVRWLHLAIAAALVLGLSSRAESQSAKEADPKPGPDAKLIDDLEDDLLRDLPGGDQPADKNPTAKTKPAAAGEKSLLDDLGVGEDIGQEPENPLAKVGQQMRSVQARIDQQDTSAQTQEIQKEIVDELSKLIEQTRKQCKGGSGKPGAGKQATKGGTGNANGQVRPGPAKESTERVGKPDSQAVDNVAVKDVMRRVWGHLPDKLRDQMQAQLSDQFLPKYEKLIEEYYKRLAEDKDGDL